MQGTVKQLLSVRFQSSHEHSELVWDCGKKILKAFLQMEYCSILLLLGWPRSDRELKKTLLGIYVLITGDIWKNKCFQWIEKNNVCHKAQKEADIAVLQQPG